MAVKRTEQTPDRWEQAKKHIQACDYTISITTKSAVIDQFYVKTSNELKSFKLAYTHILFFRSRLNYNLNHSLARRAREQTFIYQ
jgi:hypothetical protein